MERKIVSVKIKAFAAAIIAVVEMGMRKPKGKRSDSYANNKR
ncbi:MAG: hypothetical protein AABW63_00675 [Nanoarchaeota archaeon]